MLRPSIVETLTQHEMRLPSSQHPENTCKMDFNSQYLPLNNFKLGIILPNQSQTNIQNSCLNSYLKTGEKQLKQK